MFSHPFVYDNLVSMENEKKGYSPNTFSPVAGVLVLLLSFVLWMNFGTLFAALFYAWPGSKAGLLADIRGYIAIHIPFCLMFIGLLFGSNALLKTRLRDLAGSPKGFRIRYAAEAGVIYMIFSSILTLVHISHVSVNDASLQDRIIFILPVLLLTPLQTVSEEIFFRALPARIVYRDKLPETALKALPYAVICGFLFLLPHLWNPEIQNSQQMLLPMLYYFLWGAMAAFLSVATGGFEASIAMHTANNLYIALVANYQGSAMPTEALLIDSAADSAGSAAIAAVVVFIIIYSYSLWRGYVLEGFRWQGRKERS